jgi:hypothetical protein
LRGFTPGLLCATRRHDRVDGQPHDQSPRFTGGDPVSHLGRRRWLTGYLDHEVATSLHQLAGAADQEALHGRPELHQGATDLPPLRTFGWRWWGTSTSGGRRSVAIPTSQKKSRTVWQARLAKAATNMCTPQNVCRPLLRTDCDGHAGATLAVELTFPLDHSIGTDHETCSRGYGPDET